MCQTCGGTCAPGGPARPRFVQDAGDPQMIVIGTQNAPTTMPTHLVRQTGDVVSYQSLYTGLTPNGGQATYVHPGTFGATFGAGRGR